jgi:predicted acetyltransferase
MDITIEPVAVSDKSVLRNLLELYLYDFSEYDGADLNDHGLYQYEYLDMYWTEHGRHPFFLKVSGKLAGFALVRELEAGPPPLYSMAEFFVMRKYRRRKVGETFAKRLFDMFPGRWSVAEEENNLPSQVFWRKVVHEYTRGVYDEVEMVGWEGPVQKFETPKRSPD